MQCSNCHSVIEPNVNPTSICISKKSVDCRDMCKICKVYSETCVYCRIQALHKVHPITNHRLDGQELRQSKNEVVKHIRDSEYDIYIPSIQNNPNGYQILNDSLEDKLTEILRKRDSLPKKKQMDAILGDQSVEDYMFSSQWKCEKARWEIAWIYMRFIPYAYFGFLVIGGLLSLVFLPIIYFIEYLGLESNSIVILCTVIPMGLIFMICLLAGFLGLLHDHKESVNQVKNTVGYVINKYPETWEEFNWPRYEYIQAELKFLRKALRLLKDISRRENKIKKVETEGAKIPHKIEHELGYEYNLKWHLVIAVSIGWGSISRPVAESRPDPRLLCSVCGIGTGSSCDCWDDP